MKKNYWQYVALAVAISFGVMGPEITQAAASESTPMYRLYNRSSGEHFYTENRIERNNLVNIGWKYEGTGWYAPTSGDPVYRLYNPNNGDHHYTLSSSERDNLVKIGWKYEGVGWYSDTAESVPLYRAFNPNQNVGSHNYTISKSEQRNLVSLGWKDENIGWYGVDQESYTANYVNHRGNTLVAPENSLPAFRNANATGVETDLQLTKDRQWVLMHDSTLERMTNGVGNISDYTLEELQQFNIDAGNNVTSYTATDLKIPTLEDFLAICKVTNKTPFLELKDVSATADELAEVFNALTKYGFTSQNAKIISFDYQQLTLASQINPDFAYLYLVSEINQDAIDAALLLGNQPGIDSYFINVNSAAVKKARAAGLSVGVWTVNSTDFSDMNDMRVDYITTDQAQ